jgi:amidase
MDDTLGAFVPGPMLHLDGAPTGPLRGLEFAAKDIYDVAGAVTGCGNPDWARTHEAAAETAWAIRTLLEAGASLAGKTLTDELAYSLNGENYHFGTPTNVNAPGRIPGGSSNGSASAVAGGLVDFALGSDTGGSVRVPASYCGIYGLRTTHGRVPLDGVMPLAPSFDTVGWFARDAGLLRRVGEVLFGAAAADAPKPSRLLIAEDAFALSEEATRGALRPWVERLEARLGKAEPVTVGEPGGGLEDWMWRFRRLQAREICAVHGDWIAAIKPRFGPDVAERFDWAHSVSDQEAEADKPEREAFATRVAGLLQDGAVLCLPSAPAVAPKIGGDGEEHQRHRAATLTVSSIAPLSRLPQISLPLARVGGLPQGLGMIGPAGSDLSLLAFAEAFAGEEAGI